MTNFKINYTGKENTKTKKDVPIFLKHKVSDDNLYMIAREFNTYRLLCVNNGHVQCASDNSSDNLEELLKKLNDYFDEVEIEVNATFK
ncbi:hypothetical protein [Aquibacillus saliphilus]|uniref:hypothetical protein n=1 Tax=Aquibacillus saliphilus TaxID=1909422 RepID=UPI001CF0417B|nr:hypothetical protein [Aquibacillus saliphilus]